jgi:serine/threonine protein kinase
MSRDMSPPHAVKCLKQEGLHEVWLLRLQNGEQRTLKSWPLSLWMLCKLLLGIAQPQRQLRGMKRLQGINVHTPLVDGNWRVTHRGRWRVELQMQYASGSAAWEIIGGPLTPAPFNQKMLLNAALQLGELVAHLAGHGIFHRDLKPSNVVVEPIGDDQVRLWIIDTVGVRITRSPSMAIERMLERLAIQPIQFDRTLAKKIRAVVMRAALRSSSKRDRRSIMRQLRERLARTFAE